METPDYVYVGTLTKTEMARSKIAAIKALRDWFHQTTGRNLSLRDAKEMVEAIYHHAPQIDQGEAVTKMRQKLAEMSKILEGK